MEKLTKNKGITLVALVITIIILLIIAGITISQLTGENGLFSNAKKVKEAYSESQMKEDLMLAISDLNIEMLSIQGRTATLDDITQEWANEKLINYECKVITDEAINGKKIMMKKDGAICLFVIDENLNVAQKEFDGVEVIYEVKSKNGDNLEVLVTVSDYENGIDTVEFLNDGVTVQGNGKKEVSKDCTIKLGEEYKLKITAKGGKEKEKTIKIDTFYYSITKDLEEGISLSNKAIKAEYNKPYTTNIEVSGENRIIDSITVKMDGEELEVDKTTGKIEIDKVTGDIEIIITSKIAEIEVSNIIIGNSATATSSVSDNSQALGTKLYIKFNATLEGTVCTSDPEIPYEITQPGTYKFTVTGTYGTITITKNIEIEVTKYKVYLIRTRKELEYIKNDLIGTYYLMNDIDLNPELDNDGDGVADGNWTSLGDFHGKLYGNGHTIYNMTIMSDDENYLGFFNMLRGTVNGLRFVNASVTTGGNVASVLTGRFCEANVSECAIEDSRVTSGGCASAFGGDFLSWTKITNCYAKDITISTSRSTGGFIEAGKSADGYYTLTNCYYWGIYTTLYENKSRIFPDGRADVYDCYYNTTVCTPTEKSLASSLETVDFADSSNFENWDFDYVWIIKDGYPQLRCFLNE